MFGMAEDVHLLRDRSKPRGPLETFFYRVKWKYTLPLIGLVGLSLGLAHYILSNRSGRLQSVPQYPILTQPGPGMLEVEGCEDGLHRFEGFDPNLDVTQFKSLKVRYLILDAFTFSQSLSNWTNLESLVIEDVWVDGDFTRVPLPFLKKFIFHQYSNGKTDPYKQEGVLKQILFFDKDLSATWNLSKDLLNLGMSIQVKIAGTKLLNIEPTTGEININTHYCEKMLQNFDPDVASFNITSVSLHWCPVGTATIRKLMSVGGSIRYLFLNNALPSSSLHLNEVLTALPNLHELHIYKRLLSDGNPLKLNINLIPPSLETLSLTNIQISYTPKQNQGTSVKSLSLDRYVDKSVLDNLPEMFPNLTMLALFNVTQPVCQSLLEKALGEVSPDTVVVTGCLHQQTPKLRSAYRQHVYPSDSFILKKDDDGYTSTELSSFEKHFYRYKNLGFNKIDTYTDYIVWDAFPK